MSRTSVRTVSVFLVAAFLLTLNIKPAAASTTQPVAPSGHGNGGTWANIINRNDYTPAQRVQPLDLSISEPAVEQVADLAAAELMQFVSTLSTGYAAQVTGVFVDDVLAFPVVQQPSGSAGFVSTADDVVTQFSTPSQFGTLGILAHNYLAGISFFDLAVDQDVYVVYGDGSTDHYVIRDIRRFQALQPTSVYSDFVDLDTHVSYSSTDVFYEVYGNSGMLVFQTCIENEGNSSWGRLFVIAEKIS
ncbi:MAG: hypothetical protein AAGU05_00505 [Anaerolineaceae bacterium]